MWKTAGFLREAKRTAAEATSVFPVGVLRFHHTLTGKFSVNSNVCNDTRLRLLMLIHTLAVLMFATWLSRWLKDRAAGEKLTLMFDKMLILPWFCSADMLAELWCGFQHSLSVHLIGDDTRWCWIGCRFFLSFQKVFFVRIPWRVITALRSRSLGALVGLNRLALCLTSLVYVPQNCCGLRGSVTILQQLVNTKPKPFATHCFSPSSPGSIVPPSSLLSSLPSFPPFAGLRVQPQQLRSISLRRNILGLTRSGNSRDFSMKYSSCVILDMRPPVAQMLILKL